MGSLRIEPTGLADLSVSAEADRQRVIVYSFDSGQNPLRSSEGLLLGTSIDGSTDEVDPHIPLPGSPPPSLVVEQLDENRTRVVLGWPF